MRLLILIILSTFIFISCTKENLVKEVKVYYKNGHPKVVHFYEKRGLFFRELKKKKYFSEDGKLQKNESYLGQIANGKWIYYDQYGSVIREELYENGKMVVNNDS